MTERDFYELGETPERIELLDGSLLISPRGEPRHQRVLRNLAGLLEARHPDLNALTLVDVRLGARRIVNPDLVLVGPIDFDARSVDCRSVRLVAEVASPCTECVDRVLKRHYFEEAGIPEYVIADPLTGEVTRLLLDNGRYVESFAALKLVVPVA